jgi:hypothetical protein
MEFAKIPMSESNEKFYNFFKKNKNESILKILVGFNNKS